MRQSEHHEQATLIEWARNSKDIRLHFLFAVPNGGARTPGEAKKYRREGLLAGVSDLFLPVASKGCHGLFIEMKTHKGMLSDKQALFGAFVESQGYKVIVPRSFGEAKLMVEEYLATTGSERG